LPHTKRFPLHDCTFFPANDTQTHTHIPKSRGIREEEDTGIGKVMDGGAGFPFSGRNSVKVRWLRSMNVDAGHVAAWNTCIWHVQCANVFFFDSALSAP